MLRRKRWIPRLANRIYLELQIADLSLICLDSDYEKARTFRVQGRRWMGHLARSPGLFNHRVGGSHGLQPGDPTAPTVSRPFIWAFNFVC